MKKHHRSKHKREKDRIQTRKRRASAVMKTHHRLADNRPKRKARARPRRPASPKAVRRAIRRLLDTTHHIQARAAELESALDALREQERTQAAKDLLLAFRNSADGDLLRLDPAAPGDGRNTLAQAIIGALVEAFPIVPSRSPGERIPIQDGQIPDSLELDRSIADESDECTAVEVVSPGWSYNNRPLLKPVVRPLFVIEPPSVAMEPHGSRACTQTT